MTPPGDHGLFHPDAVNDGAARRKRFQEVFAAQVRTLHYVDMLLDQHVVTLREGVEHNLSVVVATSLTKALKTFEGIRTLGLLGWGEDALILLRANINLLINLAYILSDAEPAERALDFIAFSHLERDRYLAQAHGVTQGRPRPLMSAEEQASRAKRWDSVRIKGRADRARGFHYTMGYALYSSFEHSDAMALSGYITEWDEVGPRAHAGPSDEFVEIALTHSLMVFADVLLLFCGHFGIERPEVFEEIRQIVTSLTRAGEEQ